MHIATHLLVSWNAAAASGQNGRDLSLVTWAGVLPDLDGVGLAVDFATQKLGLPETTFYSWHHVYGHGLPAALVIAGVLAAFAVNRRRTALLAFLMVHLHLACDVIGSRGLDPTHLWEISYLSPLSDALRVTWSGQWPVSSWQNTVISAAMLLLAVALTVLRGVSPVALVSKRADRAVVATLRARFAPARGATTGQA